jgi:peptidoglycan/LPS O-acetylase OafA/YrhL
MLGHILSAEIRGLPLSNMATFYSKFMQRFEFQVVINALVSVDTFFLMSGCLVSYLMLKELDKTRGRVNFLVMYIHRYLRY